MNGLRSTFANLLQRRQILLSASLLVLVAGFASDPSSDVGRYLILVHFGLFLLWQPIVRPSRRLGGLDLVLLIAVLSGFVLAMSPGLLAAWVMVLTAVIGGRSFVAASVAGRMPYVLALALLVLFLVPVLVPEALALHSEDVALLSSVTQPGLPLLAIAIAFLPVESEFDPRTLGGIDLISALMILLVLAVSLLGTLALMQVRSLPYFQSLALALIGVAAGLLLLAWAWQPRLGHASLGLQLSRRLLSTGLSFETWLHELSTAALACSEPDEFLSAALHDLERFPGIVGGRWRYQPGDISGSFGRDGKHFEVFEHGGLRVELIFRGRPGEALVWHYNLMLLVLARFYREKRQTRELQLRSFEEAVHETGARLTHDVKNLLQTLNALCFVAARPTADIDALQRLFRSQLPQIAARLESTLEKLRRPGDGTLTPVDAAEWWHDASGRYEGQRIRFIADLGGTGRDLPREVYDSCLDNLLQNAIAKRRLEPEISITVEFAAGARLRVSDSGRAIDAAIARRLLRQPMQSDQGLGMGLYQASRLASAAGHCLELVRNDDGAVVLELYPAPATDDTGVGTETVEPGPSSRLTRNGPLPFSSKVVSDANSKD